MTYTKTQLSQIFETGTEAEIFAAFTIAFEEAMSTGDDGFAGQLACSIEAIARRMIERVRKIQKQKGA